MIRAALLQSTILVVIKCQKPDFQWLGSTGHTCYQLGSKLLSPEVTGTKELQDCKAACVENPRCVSVYHDELNKRCFLYHSRPLEGADGCINRGADRCKKNPDKNCHIIEKTDRMEQLEPAASSSWASAGNLRGSSSTSNSGSDSKATLDFTREGRRQRLCKNMVCDADKICDVSMISSEPRAYCREIKFDSEKKEEKNEERDVEGVSVSPAMYLLVPLSIILICAACGFLRAYYKSMAKLEQDTPSPQPPKLEQRHVPTIQEKGLPTVLTDQKSQFMNELGNSRSEVPKEGLLPDWVKDAPEKAQRGRQQARTSRHTRKERSTSPSGSEVSSHSKRSARSAGSQVSRSSVTSTGSVSDRAMKALMGTPDASDVSTATGDSHLPAARALAKQWDAEEAEGRGRNFHRAPREGRRAGTSPSNSSAGSTQSRRSNRM